MPTLQFKWCRDCKTLTVKNVLYIDYRITLSFIRGWALKNTILIRAETVWPSYLELRRAASDISRKQISKWESILLSFIDLFIGLIPQYIQYNNLGELHYSSSSTPASTCWGMGKKRNQYSCNVHICRDPHEAAKLIVIWKYGFMGGGANYNRRRK